MISSKNRAKNAKKDLETELLNISDGYLNYNKNPEENFRPYRTNFCGMYLTLGKDLPNPLSIDISE